MLLQPADDHERVQEAVARTLAMGLMSEDFSVDLNDWLNPTEVCSRINYLSSYSNRISRTIRSDEHKVIATANGSWRNYFSK